MNAELLHAVDGFDLPQEYRVLLRPGEAETDFQGNVHRLPRFFYEIRSWQDAHEIRLASHFTLAELMLVDCREARLLLSQFPHYVPCAIVLLARFLEDFRREADAPVFISANGGYRSPAHQIGGAKSIHAWEKSGSIAASLSPALFLRPFGPERGQTDDHLHIDLGFVSLTPRGCSEAL